MKRPKKQFFEVSDKVDEILKDIENKTEFICQAIIEKFEKTNNGELDIEVIKSELRSELKSDLRLLVDELKKEGNHLKIAERPEEPTKSIPTDTVMKNPSIKVEIQTEEKPEEVSSDTLARLRDISNDW